MHSFRPDETMTKEEAEEVVRRFQETVSAGRPRVADVAEALGTTPEDVARILSEVRGQTPAVLPQERSPRRLRIALASATAFLLLGSGVWAVSRRAAPPLNLTIESPTTPAIAADGVAKTAIAADDTAVTEARPAPIAEAPASDVAKASDSGR